MFLAAEPRF